MPYARRDTTPWIPGNFYHIYNRGVQKQVLFREEDNYLYVLRKAKHYTQVFQIAMIAYCLMPNHYHFLLRQDGDSPAGYLPQRIFNGYTKAYNHRYGTSGTLFERRYQVRKVDSIQHLLHLCRYIHANPVKDGLVSDPIDWPYSNYQEWIDTRPGTLVDHSFSTEHFQSTQAYQAFTLDYLRTRNLPDGVQNHLIELEK